MNEEEELRILQELAEKERKQYKPLIYARGELKNDLTGTYDKGISSNQVGQLQDYRAERQSIADRLANGTGNLAVGIGANVVNGIVQAGALLLSPLALRDDVSIADDLLNNPISKAITNIQDKVREELPIYKRDEYESKGLGKILDSEFWGGTMMDGAAFAISAYLSGNMFSKGFSSLTNGLGKRTILGMAEETAGSAIAKGLGAGDAIFNPNNISLANKIASSLFSATSESAVESLSTYKSIKEQLTAELVNKKKMAGGLGILSEEEEKDIENKSTSAANTSLMLNLGLVGFSDMVQFGKHFTGMTEEVVKQQALKKATNKVVDAGYEAVKAKTKKQKLFESLNPYANVAKNMAVEAGEEGSQFVIEKALENYYAGNEEVKGDIINSLSSAFKGLGSPEGIESMLASALIGGGTGAIGIRGDIKRSKEEKSAIEQWVKDANDKYSFDTFRKNILTESVSDRLELNTRGEMASLASQTAVSQGDELSFNFFQSVKFADTVTHYVKAGRFQDLVDNLQDFGNASPAELMDIYKDDIAVSNNTKAENLTTGIRSSGYKELSQNLIDKATKIKEEHDTITKRYGTTLTPEETALIASVRGLAYTATKDEADAKAQLSSFGFDYDAEITNKVKSTEQVNALIDNLKSKKDGIVGIEQELSNLTTKLRSKLDIDSTADVTGLRADKTTLEAKLKDSSNEALKLDQEIRDSVNNSYQDIIKEYDGVKKNVVVADYMKQFKKLRSEFMNKMEFEGNRTAEQTLNSDKAKYAFKKLEDIQKIKNQYIALSNKFGGEKAKEEVSKFNEKVKKVKEANYLNSLTTINDQDGNEIKLDTGWYYIKHIDKDPKKQDAPTFHKSDRTYFEITGFEVQLDKLGNKEVYAVYNDSRLDNDSLTLQSTEKKINVKNLNGKIMKLSDKYDNATEMSNEDRFYMLYRGRVMDYKYKARNPETKKWETKVITGVVSKNEAGYLSVVYFDAENRNKETFSQPITLEDNSGFYGAFQVSKKMSGDLSQKKLNYAISESQYLKVYTEDETRQWLELQTVNRAIVGIENDIKKILESKAQYVPNEEVMETIKFLQSYANDVETQINNSQSIVQTLVNQHKDLQVLKKRLDSKRKSFIETLYKLEIQLILAKDQLSKLSGNRPIGIQSEYNTLRDELKNRVDATQELINEYKGKDAKTEKHIEMLNKLNNTKIKRIIANVINNDIVRKDSELSDVVVAAIQSLNMIGIDEDYMNNELTQDQTFAIAEYILEHPNNLELIEIDGTKKIVPNTFFDLFNELIDEGNPDELENNVKEIEEYKQLLSELASTLLGEEVLEANTALRNQDRKNRDIRAKRQDKQEQESKDKANFMDRLSTLDYLMPEEIVLRHDKQRKLELLNFENAVMYKLKGLLFKNTDVDLADIKGYDPYFADLIAPLMYSSEEDEKADSPERVSPSIEKSPLKSISSSSMPLTLAQASGNDRHHWAFSKVLDGVDLKNAGIFIQWRTSAPPSQGTEEYKYEEYYDNKFSTEKHKNIIGVLVEADGTPVKVNNNGKLDPKGTLLAITHLEEPTRKTSGGYNRFQEVDLLDKVTAEIGQAFNEGAKEDDAKIQTLRAKQNGLESTIQEGLKKINDYRISVLDNIGKTGVSNHVIDGQNYGIPIIGTTGKSPKVIFGDDLAEQIHKQNGLYEIIIASGESHPSIPNKKLKAGRAYLVNKLTKRAIYLNTRKLNNTDVSNIIDNIIAIQEIDSASIIRSQENLAIQMGNIRGKIHFGLSSKYPEKTLIKNGKKDVNASTEGTLVTYDETNEPLEILKDKLYSIGFVPNSGSSKIEYGTYIGKDATGKALYTTTIVDVDSLKSRTEEGIMFEDFLRNRWHNISNLITKRNDTTGETVMGVNQINYLLDYVLTTRIAPSSQVQYKSTYLIPNKQSIVLASKPTIVTPITNTTVPTTPVTNKNSIIDPNGIYQEKFLDIPLTNKIKLTLRALINNFKGMTKEALDAFNEKEGVNIVAGNPASTYELHKFISSMLEKQEDSVSNYTEEWIKPELLNTPITSTPAPVLDGLMGEATDGGDGVNINEENTSFASIADGVDAVVAETPAMEEYMLFSDELDAELKQFDQEKRLTEADKAELLARPVSKRLNGYGVEVKIVNGLIDNKAFGKFQKALNSLTGRLEPTVTISEQAPIGTLYHEEFHVVEQALMPVAYRAAVYNDWRTVNNKPNATDKDVSEALAEEYRYYALNKDSETMKHDNSLLTRAMKYLFNRVMRMVEYLTFRKSPKLEKLFNEIYSGQAKAKFSASSTLNIDTQSFTVNQRQDLVKSMAYSYYNNLLGSGIDIFTYLNELTKHQNLGNKTYKQYEDDKLFEILTKKNVSGDTLEDKIFNLLIKQKKSELNVVGNATMSALLDNQVVKDEVKKSFFRYLEKINPTYTTKEEKNLSEVGIKLNSDGTYNTNTEENTNTTEAEDDYEDESVNNKNNAVEQIPSNELDPKKQISRTVKQLLISIVAHKGNVNEIKTNSLGLKQHTDLSNTLNSLYRDLSDIDSIDEMYEILERKATTNDTGSVLYKEIAKALKFEAIKGEEKVSGYRNITRKWSVENSFLSQFNKTHLDLISVRYDKEGFKVINENTSEAIKKYKDKLRSYVLRTNAGKPQLGKLLNNTNMREVLKELGINFPAKLELVSRERELKTVQDMWNEIAGLVNKQLSEGKGSAYQVLEKWSKMNAFLAELNKYDNQVPSFAATNAEGKKVYAMQQQTYLTKTVKSLKQIALREYEAVQQKLKSSRTNEEYKATEKEVDSSIFNVANLRNIKVSTLLGYKGSNKAQKANALSEGDMLFMFSNMAFSGYVPFIFPADKSTYNVISGMIPYKSNTTVEDIADLYIQQLEQEIEEAYMFVNVNGKKQSVKNLFPVTKSVLAFSNNSNAVKDIFKGYEDRLVGANLQSRQEVKAEIKSMLLFPLSGFIQNQLYTLNKGFKDSNVALNEEGFVDLTTLPDSKLVTGYKQGTTHRQVLTDLLAFNTANMMLQGKYFVGGLSNYKSATDFAKRAAGALATKTVIRSDRKFIEDFDKHLEGMYEYFGINLKPIKFTNFVSSNGQEKAVFDSITVNDIKIDSRNNKAISKLKADFKKAYDAYGSTTTVKNGVATTYYEIDVTDAQGFEHIDSIRFRGIAEGTWTDKMEEIYKKDLRNIPLSFEEVMAITAEKTQYYGKQYLPNNTASKELFDQSNNATFYKLSVLPITRSLSIDERFKNTIGKMDKFMRTNNIPLVMVSASNKVGRVTNKGTMSFNEAFNATDKRVTELKQTSFWEDYGTQVSMDKTDKSKQTKATQHRKLIMLNTLRNNGNLTINGKTVSALSLYDKLNTMENEKLQVLLDDVIKELNLVENANGMLSASDMSILAKSVIAQLEERESPQNVIDSVASTLGMSKGIDLLNNKAKIESIATAFVNKIIKQKVAGSSLPQIANVFDRILEAGDNVYNEDGTRTPLVDEKGNPISREELKFYDDGYLEVYLPNHYKKFFNVKGEIDPKLMTMVGFRIPVQGHNSMERIKVKGFLPANLGNMMVVPYEITKKAGSDFDIDKLNLYYYGVTKEGEMIPDFTTEEEFKKWYGDKDIKNYNKYKAKALDNAMLTTYLDVLSSEEVQKMMLIPVADDELKSAVSSVRENRGVKEIQFTDYFNPATNASMKTSFEGGKQVLGAVALHNTHHALSQFAKLVMAGGFKFRNYNKDNNGVSLYSTDTTNGELISDNISQLMSGAVDVAKDDYIKDINLTLQTSATYLMLIRAGIPLKDVVYFMSQPIITEYVNNYNKVNSNYYSTTKQEMDLFTADKFAKSMTMENLEKFKGVDSKQLPQLTTEYLKDGLIKDDISNEIQYNVFMEFLAVKEKAEVLSRFMNTTAYDTKGINNTLIQASKQVENYNRVIEDIKKEKLFFTNGELGMNGFFEYKSPNGLTKKTFLGKMKEIVDKSSVLLSPLYNNSFNHALGIMKSYGIRTNSTDIVGKYTSIINGVINATITNMRLFDNNSLGSRLDYLFKGSNSLADRINNLTDKNKFKFLDMLSLEPRTKSISMNGSNSLDVYETDDLIDAFYELEAKHPDIANDLVDIVLLQSGVSNSPTTFLNIIPFEKIMERVGQFYQNDYFDKDFQHLVILNDYKKLLPFRSMQDMGERPPVAFYRSGTIEGTYDIEINGVSYTDNEGLITTNGQVVAQIEGVVKRDYKKRGYVGTSKANNDSPVNYAKYLGYNTTVKENVNLEDFIKANQDAINKGLLTKEEVSEHAKRCGKSL